MGQSKIPIFAYVDESGNTGKNIFDEQQPNFFTAALLSKGDFDALWTDRINAIADTVGSKSIHANELGLAKLETVAKALYELLEKSNVHFFLSRVEKRYLLATKMFDVLFDSGENAAVHWHTYNFRPLKIIMAFKLSAVVNDVIARDFWSCLLLPTEEQSQKIIPNICEALKSRLSDIPDARSREILGNGLDWVIKHPEAIHFGPEQKIAKQGHFPNLVAFTSLLQGLQHFSDLWKKRIAKITHDEQSEFGSMLQTWHKTFSNAAPDVIEWAGETYRLQWTPGSAFVMKKDTESVGIQMADVALWLYAQAAKGKELPEWCGQILTLVLDRGFYNDFSFAGVERHLMNKWGDILFGPMEPEKIERGRKLVEESEERRKQSMAQYEIDGIPPFMRHTPKLKDAHQN